MAIKDYPEKYSWWISELKSLGVNTEAKDEELTDIRALEDLTDNIIASSKYFFSSQRDYLD